MRPLVLVFVAIALVFWIGIAPKLINTALPHTWWLDVREVHISDSLDGSSPAVIIDRDINATYRGNLRTALRRVTAGPDDFPSVCRRVRENVLFTEGLPYPDRLVTLAEIQDVPPNAACTLELGASYAVEFTWERQVWWLPGVPLSFTVESNIFSVGAAR